MSLVLCPFTGRTAYSVKKPADRGIICLLLGLFCHAFKPSLEIAHLFRVSLGTLGVAEIDESNL